MTTLVIILIAGYVVLSLLGLALWQGHKRAARLRRLEDEDAAMDLADSGNDRARVSYTGEADCS